jgi:hypothetical protein
MSTATYVTMTGSKLTFADSAADLDTAGTDATCQIIAATVEGVAKSSTIPATFCDPESDIAQASGRQLVLRFLQDWTNPDGVCRYLDGADGTTVYFRLDLPPGAAKTTRAEGRCSAVAPAFGGETGQAVEATITLPVLPGLTIADVDNPTAAP